MAVEINMHASWFSLTSFPGSLSTASLCHWEKDPVCGWSHYYPESVWSHANTGVKDSTIRLVLYNHWTFDKKGLHFFEQRDLFKSVGCDWESLIVTEKVSIFFFPLWFDGCVKYGQSVVELIIWEFTCHCQRHSDTYDGHFFYWSLFVSLFFSILNLASYWRKESVHWSSSCSLQALSIVLAQVLWRNHCILWQWDFWGSSLSW